MVAVLCKNFIIISVQVKVFEFVVHALHYYSWTQNVNFGGSDSKDLGEHILTPQKAYHCTD